MQQNIPNIDPSDEIDEIPESVRAERFENAKKILRESRIPVILQEFNTHLLKGRGWFEEYSSGVIMKWGTGYTRRHIWIDVDEDRIRIRLLPHRKCVENLLADTCDGEYHIYTPKQWKNFELIRNELKAYYDKPVAEASDD